MKNYIYIIIAIITLSSCEIDPQRKKKDRIKLIEELTITKTDSLKLELDSICIEMGDKRFEELVDSVLEAKVDEIKAKIKKYDE